MPTLSEIDLQIEFPRTVIAKKFDDASHGLSHCMKAVDFIFELDDRILFVEFKDPDDPSVPPRRRRQFMKKFLSDVLNNDLKTKYRDSFLYEWASGNVTKPIHFLVLLGMESLSPADLLARTDALRRQIPVRGPANRRWINSFVAECLVMNIATWNRTMPDFPVSRVGAG